MEMSFRLTMRKMSDLTPFSESLTSLLLAYLSRRLKDELIVYPCSGVRRCRYRRRCCRCQPFSNMNISKASRPIAIKFYLKHHWGEGRAAWGFCADQSRTLDSIATDSSHRVIMVKQRHHVFSSVFGFFSYLQVTMTSMRAWMSSKFGRIQPRTTELAALEHMEKSH